MSRTKIIATWGPACASEKNFTAMLRGGLDVVRLNVSHQEPENLLALTARLRGIAQKAGLPLAVLADMPGPKIRCTACEPQAFPLKMNGKVEIAPGKEISTPERIYIPYDHLLDDVKEGHEIAINDGLVHIRVKKVDKKAGVLRGQVIMGGEVASRKGVSFLQSKLRIAGLTERDYRGLAKAAEAEVDFIALSFVRSPEDVEAARKVLKKAGAQDIPLIAKIEQHEAVSDFESILDVSDGIMVARGDMGIERPLEQVPLLQKNIIESCNEKNRFVITATQMLESMIENPRPTRAEVSDVANAILDGTDAVMLSAETAMGRHPGLTLRTMTRIALEAEKRIDPLAILNRLQPHTEEAGDNAVLDDALAHAACHLAHTTNLDALVCISFYGSTARRIARYRPACPIYVLSPYEEQCRRLALTWGVEIFPFPESDPEAMGHLPAAGELIPYALATLKKQRRLKKGNRVAMLAGVPLDDPGGTNWLRVVVVD